jgi:hypothetical protein
MAVAGLILLLAGFALVIPRDGISGSAAIRNVEIEGSHIERTPGYRGASRAPAGYQEAPAARAQWIRIGLGLAMLAVGVVFLIVAV